MPARPINPFIIGNPVPVSKFIGRRQEVSSILSQLANPNALGSSAISGEPRIGKTSLLDYISDSEIAEKYGLKSDRYVFIRIDGHALDKYIQDQGLKTLTDNAFWHYILRSLIENKLYDTELTRRLRDLYSITSFDLDDLFDEVASKNKLVVLLLDEFDWIIAHVDRQQSTLLNTLRALINRPVAKRGLALVTSSHEPLDTLCKDIAFTGSPFPNSLVHVHLRPFSTEEAHELLRAYLQDTDISFTKEDVEFVTHISGYHPHFLQLACFYLFEAYPKKKRISKIDREEARQAAQENFTVQAQPHFAQYWERSSEDIRSVLTTLAQRSQARGPRAWMANRRYRALSRRRDLISLVVNRGIVVESDGDHQIFSPLFATWIVSHQTGTKGRIHLTGKGLLGKLRKVPLLFPLIVLLLLCWFIPDFSDWIQADVLRRVNETPIVGLYNSKGEGIQATVYSPRLLRMGAPGTIQVVICDPEKPDIDVIPQPNSGIVPTRDTNDPTKFAIECKDTSPGFIPVKWTEYRQIDIVATMPITGSLPVTTPIPVKTNYVFSLITKLLLLVGSVIASLVTFAERIKKILAFVSTASRPNAAPRP